MLYEDEIIGMGVLAANIYSAKNKTLLVQMENMGHESEEQVQGRISSGKVNKRSNEVNGELWVAFSNSVITAVLISQQSFDRYDVMFCAHEQHYSPNALSTQTISSWSNTDKFTAEISCCCFHSILFKFGCPAISNVRHHTRVPTTAWLYPISTGLIPVEIMPREVY